MGSITYFDRMSSLLSTFMLPGDIRCSLVLGNEGEAYYNDSPDWGLRSLATKLQRKCIRAYKAEVR